MADMMHTRACRRSMLSCCFHCMVFMFIIRDILHVLEAYMLMMTAAEDEEVFAELAGFLKLFRCSAQSSFLSLLFLPLLCIITVSVVLFPLIVK